MSLSRGEGLIRPRQKTLRHEESMNGVRRCYAQIHIMHGYPFIHLLLGFRGCQGSTNQLSPLPRSVYSNASSLSPDPSPNSAQPMITPISGCQPSAYHAKLALFDLREVSNTLRSAESINIFIVIEILLDLEVDIKQRSRVGVMDDDPSI